MHDQDTNLLKRPTYVPQSPENHTVSQALPLLRLELILQQTQHRLGSLNGTGDRIYWDASGRLCGNAQQIFGLRAVL
ncbi:hypothetical protein I5S78_16100 [Pseudomonas putida]|nr:hypothetical protein [Pseudomonas putida]MBH3417868.1 hypothetical protein [Pseudomonas putida]MDG9816070.1 hypothetical protein [Pseudomonas putida]